jgi:hypothetical protein
MSPVFSSLAARAASARWQAVYRGGRWLLGKGREFWGNLADAERRELGELLRKSKGRRRNLAEHEFARLRELVRKGFSRPR